MNREELIEAIRRLGLHYTLNMADETRDAVEDALEFSQDAYDLLGSVYQYLTGSALPEVKA